MNHDSGRQHDLKHSLICGKAVAVAVPLPVPVPLPLPQLVPQLVPLLLPVLAWPGLAWPECAQAAQLGLVGRPNDLLLLFFLSCLCIF